MSTDQSNALAMFVDSTRTFIGDNDHTWIVLHKTAGFTTAQDVAAFFATVADMRSAHYVVGQDGTVVQCVPESDGAGANCCLEAGHAPYLPDGVNLNTRTVSIEHVDPASDNSTPLTDAQKAASFALIKGICERHNIPQRGGDASGGIIGHNDLDPASRARCPGNYPWDELWAYLNNPTTTTSNQNSSQENTDMPMDITNPFAAMYFKETSPTSWHCDSTKVDLHDGMLGYWRRTQGALRLPRTNEVYGLFDSGSLQVFECGVLVFDPKRVFDNPPTPGDVFAAHLDTDNAALRQLIGLAGLAIQGKVLPTENLNNAASGLNAIIAAAQNVLHDIGKS